MDESKPKRRWFQFNLRMLFVLVALAACATAWFCGQIHLVKDRMAFRDKLFASDGSFESIPGDAAAIPWWRKWLGDYAVDRVRVPDTCEPAFQAEAVRLFPESKVIPISKEEMDADVPDRVKKERAARDKLREMLRLFLGVKSNVPSEQVNR